MQGLALRVCNARIRRVSLNPRKLMQAPVLLGLVLLGVWTGPVVAQVVDDQFGVSVDVTATSLPELAGGYVADGSIQVTVTDGASCPGTTYTVAAAPVANSSPLGNTPPITTITAYIGFQASYSPFNFDAAGAGTYDITVTETGDCVPAVNPVVTQAVVPEAAYADLQISKLDNRDPIKSAIGAELVYTITVTNNGPSDVPDAFVTDTLPSGVEFKSTSGCSNDPTGVPQCQLGVIAAGNSASYDIVVGLNVDAASIVNSATVASSIFDPDLGNNSAIQETSVVPQSIPANTPLGLMLMALLLGGFGWLAIRRS